MVNTGLSAVIGSWKTSAISAPRTFCIARSSSVIRSRPLNRIRPPAIRPGRWTRRRIDSAVTDFPLPDSPTRQSVSPLSTWKLTSMTAGAVHAGRSNTVLRRSTARRLEVGGWRIEVGGWRLGEGTDPEPDGVRAESPVVEVAPGTSFIAYCLRELPEPPRPVNLQPPIPNL